MKRDEISSSQRNLTPPQLTLLYPTRWRDYELVDSGNGHKLERYGHYLFLRPEPQAMWSPAHPEKSWESAHAVFQPTQEESGGHWKKNRPMDESWVMHFNQLRFRAQLTAGRHLGVFPEQACHWDWISNKLGDVRRPVQILNLFGYTGLATLAAARSGAKVTHVDASNKAITWARENQALSGLNNHPVRWIVDDALKFVQREINRKVHYDGIILDPPKFGRGPRGEVWEFFDLFPRLMHLCRDVLSPQPLFIVVTAYAIRASASSLFYLLTDLLAELGGEVTAGELGLIESSASRIVSTALYARWEAG